MSIFQNLIAGLCGGSVTAILIFGATRWQDALQLRIWGHRRIDRIWFRYSSLPQWLLWILAFGHKQPIGDDRLLFQDEYRQWHFWDETFDEHGPFATKTIARKELKKYVESLR